MIVILTATFFAIMIAWFLSQTGMQVYAATLDNNSKTWSEDSTINNNVTIDGGVTVDANIALKIPEGKTLFVWDGINAKDRTLTVEGKGTLIVYGESGNLGSDGGSGFTGNLIVNGTNVTVKGGYGDWGNNGGVRPG